MEHGTESRHRRKVSLKQTIGANIAEGGEQENDSKKIFFSYSKYDKNLLKDLQKHLSPLVRQGKIQLWDDSKIFPGEEWDNTIRRELDEADIILLLVSADFFATDYIWNVEIAHALERHRRKEAIVVPVILRPCDWTATTFSHLNALPEKGTPVTSYSDPHIAWMEVVHGIRSLLAERTHSLSFTLPPVVFRSRSFPLRLLFRHFPAADTRKKYFLPLEQGPDNHQRQVLTDTFLQYVSPSNFTFDLSAYMASPSRRKIHQSALESNMFRLFTEGFLQDSSTNVLLLADSGMGKTTFLQYLFYNFAKTYPPEHLAFVYAGADTLKVIRSIANKKNTILFLDGLDEDHDARRELSATLARLSNLLRNFKKVIVSSRVQFFTDQQEEWKGLGGNLKLEQVTLMAFSREEAKIYLQKKFAQQPDFAATAILIFYSAPDFFCRPLLLTWFDMLLYNKKMEYNYLFEVYETIVQEWAKREADIVEPDTYQGKRYPAKLLKFSKKLTFHLYQQQTGMLEAGKFEAIAALAKSLGITQRDAQSRSFLTRNQDDDSWAFSHKSFFDYFLAVLLFDQDIREEDFLFSNYPDSERFFNEMCWKKYAGRAHPPKEEDIPVYLGNDAQMQRVFPNTRITVIPSRAIRALATQIPADKWRTYMLRREPHTCWESLIGFLRAFLPEKTTLEHYFFKDYTAYQAIINGGPGEQIEERFYVHSFLAEYVYWKHTAFRDDNRTGAEVTNQESSFIKYLKNYDFSRSFQENLPECLQSMEIGDLFKFVLTHNQALKSCITDLDLSNSDIVELETLQHLFALPELRVLRLSGNYITSSKVLGQVLRLPKLRTLDLSNNRITDIEILYQLDSLPALRSLDLSGNSIADLQVLRSLPALPELRTLDLSGNRIADVQVPRPLLELPELQKLYLYGNNIEPALVGTDRNFNCVEILRDQILFPPNMVFVKGGSFEMGQPYTKQQKQLKKQVGRIYISDNQPCHSVRLDAYYIGRYPVTIGEFRRFIQATGYETEAEINAAGSYLWDFEEEKKSLTKYVNWQHDASGQSQTNDRLPVIHVSWNDACAYCIWLSDETGIAYRLPTEAEWEYAAKGGPHVEAYKFKFAGSNKLDEVGWYYKNSGAANAKMRTHAVGKKKPNPLGLYDMNGNVHEWCSDLYDSEYYSKCNLSGVVHNPLGLEGSEYVLRGGHWRFNEKRCRTTYRGNNPPDTRHQGIGFRLAFSLPSTDKLDRV